MSVQVRSRRESAAFLSTYVGAQGEILIDTTNNRVQVHDGATPGGWPAARLADVAQRMSLANANYTALTSDRLIAFTSLGVARTVTLPAASTFPTGAQLLVVDESGACSVANTITIARAGSNTINGATSTVLSMPYGYVALESNGVSKWSIIDQSTASLAQQDAGNVAITGGAIDGTAIGGTTPAEASVTKLTTTAANGSAGSVNKIALFSTNYGFGISSGSLDYVGNTHSFYSNLTLLGRFTSTGLNATAIGATNASTVRGTTVAATTSFNLPSYTVATLPAAGSAGRAVHCSNARMMGTAGTLETAGSGTGGLVTDNGTAWKLAGTNVNASA